MTLIANVDELKSQLSELREIQERLETIIRSNLRNIIDNLPYCIQFKFKGIYLFEYDYLFDDDFESFEDGINGLERKFLIDVGESMDETDLDIILDERTNFSLTIPNEPNELIEELEEAFEEDYDEKIIEGVVEVYLSNAIQNLKDNYEELCKRTLPLYSTRYIDMYLDELHDFLESELSTEREEILEKIEDGGYSKEEVQELSNDDIIQELLTYAEYQLWDTLEEIQEDFKLIL